MRLLAIVMGTLLVLIQYPLWLGHGSWRRVWELDQRLGWVQAENAGKRLRNQALEAEARDLEKAAEAVDERARYELGMMRPDEIFVSFTAEPGDSGR